jgi:serine/threonine protein kinase
VLFILVAGTPPFNTAEEKDYYYKMILKDRMDLFWKCHIKGKPSGANFFSEEFKNLMQHMFAYDPAKRLSISELRAHPWLTGPLPSYDEVVLEFK